MDRLILNARYVHSQFPTIHYPLNVGLESRCSLVMPDTLMLDGLFLFDCIAAMKLRIIASMVLCFFGLVLSGCYTTVDGGKKAGVPWMKDTIEGRYERSVDQLYEASLAVLSFNGTLVSENRINNSIVAKVDTTTVYVQIEPIGPSISRVLVQSRTRFGRPDVDLSSEIEKQIALELK
jgi:hypothetical protein